MKLATKILALLCIVCLCASAGQHDEAQAQAGLLADLRRTLEENGLADRPEQVVEELAREADESGEELEVVVMGYLQTLLRRSPEDKHEPVIRLMLQVRTRLAVSQVRDDHEHREYLAEEGRREHDARARQLRETLERGMPGQQELVDDMMRRVEESTRNARELDDVRRQRADHLELEAESIRQFADKVSKAGFISTEEAMAQQRKAIELLEVAKRLRVQPRIRQTASMLVPQVLWSPQKAQGSVVIVPTDEIAQDDLAAINEDMAVMSRIIERVIDEAVGKRPGPGSMRSLFGGGGSRHLYLQGYGAVFTTSVSFALTGPEARPRPEAAPEPDSLWEQTRRELHGHRQPADPNIIAGGGGLADFYPHGPARYEPSRVEALTDALLGNLRHATNIRALDDDESVVVVVVGGPALVPVSWGFGGLRMGPPGIPMGPPAGAPKAPPAGIRMGQPTGFVTVVGSLAKSHGSVLVIRVTKKALDDLEDAPEGAPLEATIMTY